MRVCLAGIVPMPCTISATDGYGISAMLSAARRRKDGVELLMVTVYVVLTGYFLVCHCPPRIAFAVRDAVAPFQIKARARKAGAERSAAVWSLSQFETRTPLSR